MFVGASIASAQPQQGYIGLFNDDTRTWWCASGTPIYTIEIWLLCLPSERGQQCVEFGLRYPHNVVRSTHTLNTIVLTGIPGNPGFVCDGDICYASLCYIACQWDWHWVLRHQLFVTDTAQSSIEIVAHPDVGVYQFANCEPGYPVEPCIAINSFYLNYGVADPECTVGVESASWGSIKSLLR
jgi:hypothetical protein